MEHKQTERLEYIDIFRGFPLLVMITIQIFDYLSTSSIYTTPPYYVDAINSVTWIPPSLLFAFVSGMSVFLLMQKLSLNNQSKRSVLSGVIKRYGIYIVISFPFTIVMWNMATYFAWEEVIQGIGLSAIITAIFLIMLPKIKYIYIITAIVSMAFLQSYLLNVIRISDISYTYPFFIEFDNSITITTFAISVLLNIFIRGWFSVVNIFPLMLGGLLFFLLIKEKRTFIYSLALGAIPLIISVILHLNGYPIDYYNRSFSFTFFAIGESAIICSLLYFIYKKINWNFLLKPLLVFGRASILIYLGHYLLILKVLEITGIKDTLSDPVAWLITLPLVGIVYYCAEFYLKRRKANFTRLDDAQNTDLKSNN